MKHDLTDKVVLVAGASRGVGRGVAHELGLAGAKVYVTGRTRDGEPANEGLAGTIDDTARLVDASGGRGVAIRCDHTRDADVEALPGRIEEERLDVLVIAVWGGYEDYDPARFSDPPEAQPVTRWDKMIATGPRAAYVTTRAVLPCLLRAAHPLVVLVSAGDDGKFLGDVQYDVAKATVDRLGFAFARRLRRQRVSVVTIHPGLTRTERVEKHARAEDLGAAHTARLVGRGVVALAGAPEAAAARSGRAVKIAQLARDLGFTDVDGTVPAPFTLPDDL